MRKFPSSQRDGTALPAHPHPMSLSQTASNLRFSSRVHRVVLQRESLPVMAIPMRRLPSEEIYGVMMSFDAVRGKLINSIGVCDSRFVAVRPAGTHFSSVSLTLDDVRCH